MLICITVRTPCCNLTSLLRDLATCRCKVERNGCAYYLLRARRCTMFVKQQCCVCNTVKLSAICAVLLNPRAQPVWEQYELLRARNQFENNTSYFARATSLRATRVYFARATSLRATRVTSRAQPVWEQHELLRARNQFENNTSYFARATSLRTTRVVRNVARVHFARATYLTAIIIAHCKLSAMLHKIRENW